MELVGELDSTSFKIYPIYILMGAVLSFPLFFLGIREQLAAVQAEVAGL